MKNYKSLIRHEILNLLTVITIMIEEPDLNRIDRKQLRKIIQVIGILVSREEIFSGKKVKFFKEEFNLNDILSLALIIHEKCLNKKKVPITLPNEDFLAFEDKTVIKEFLDELVSHLCPMAKSIRFAYEQPKRKLMIHYEATESLDFKEKTLLDCLKEKECLVKELPIRVAMHLMNLSGIRVQWGKKTISVIFGGDARSRTGVRK